MAAAIPVKDQILAMVTTDRLEGFQNWHMWKRKVSDLIRLKNLEGHIMGTTVRPAPIAAVPAIPATTNTPAVPAVPANDAAGELWDTNDHIAHTNLTWNIVDTDLHGITDAHTSAEVWTILWNRYDQVDLISQQALLNRLKMIKYVDGTPMHDHIAQLAQARTIFGLMDPEYRVRGKKLQNRLHYLRCVFNYLGAIKGRSGLTSAPDDCAMVHGTHVTCVTGVIRTCVTYHLFGNT